MVKQNKETKIKHIFGAYELRLSDAKVEIEDKNKLSKHVYAKNTFEYGLISYLLSKEDVKAVEILVYSLAYTNLLFSNAGFRRKYWELIYETVKNVDAVESTDDEKIIEEMKAEHEANE